METRQRKRVAMDLDSKWAKTTAGLMAVSLFLRAVYYLGIKNFADIGFIGFVFCAVIPLILSSIYVVLLYAVRRNAAGLYGLIAAAFCVLLIIWSLYSGNVIRIILSIAWYGITAGIVIFSTGGSMQNTSLFVASFVIPIVVRFFVFDIGRLGIFDSIAETSVLCLLASLACFPLTLSYPKK